MANNQGAPREPASAERARAASHVSAERGTCCGNQNCHIKCMLMLMAAACIVIACASVMGSWGTMGGGEEVVGRTRWTGMTNADGRLWPDREGLQVESAQKLMASANNGVVSGAEVGLWGPTMSPHGSMPASYEPPGNVPCVRGVSRASCLQHIQLSSIFILTHDSPIFEGARFSLPRTPLV